MNKRSSVRLVAFFLVFSGCATYLSTDEMALEFYNLGNAYNSLERFEEAARYYQRALLLDPSLMDAGYNLSRVLVLQEDYEQAIEILLELQESDPDNLMVTRTLGYAYYEAGRTMEAYDSYLKVHHQLPVDENALYNLAVIATVKEDWEASVRFYAELESSRELSETELLGLLVAMFQQGDFDTVLTRIESLLEDSPEKGDFWLLKAQVHRSEERYQEAIEAYEAAAGFDPIRLSRGEIYWELALIMLNSIEDTVQGKEYLQQAIESGYENEEEMSYLLETISSPLAEEIRTIFLDAGFFKEEESEE